MMADKTRHGLMSTGNKKNSDVVSSAFVVVTKWKSSVTAVKLNVTFSC